MLNKRIGILVLSSVLSMGMLVGCNKEEVNNQVEEQQIQEEVQEEIDDTDGGNKLSSSEISDEEIIAKTKDYYYCDTQSFIGGYRENYKYRDGKGYVCYDSKEKELCDILDSLSDNDVDDGLIDYYCEVSYGQLLRYIDYLEESNQTDSECYKLATEVRDIYNGEFIDIEYFNRAKEILFKEHPNTDWYKDEKETQEQSKEVQEETIQEKNKSKVISTEQKQALKKAELYLDLMGFSKEGLRKQLAYDGFEDESIDYALENVDVDWNEEALEKAEQYMDLMGFSKEGMRNQLKYDGFEDDEIEYAINKLY